MTKFHKTFSSTIDWMIFFHKFESNHVFLRIRHFLFSIEFRLLIQFFSIFYFQHDSKSFRIAIVFFCKSYRFSIKTRCVSTKIWCFDNNHKKKAFFESFWFIDVYRWREFHMTHLKNQNAWQNDDQQESFWDFSSWNHYRYQLNDWENRWAYSNRTKSRYKSFQKSSTNDEVSRQHLRRFWLQTQHSHQIQNIDYEKSRFSIVFFNFFIFEQSNRLQRNSKNWKIIRKTFIFVEKNVERLFTSIRYFCRNQNRIHANAQRLKKNQKEENRNENCTITMFCFYFFQNYFCCFDIDASCEIYDSLSSIYRVFESKSWFCYWHVDFHEQMFHLRRVKTYVKVLSQRATIQETSMTWFTDDSNEHEHWIQWFWFIENFFYSR